MKKKFIKITALAVVCCLLLCGIPQKSAVKADEISDLRQQILDLQNELAQLKQWQEESAEEKNELVLKIQVIQNEEIVLQQQVDISQQMLDQIVAQLNDLTTQLGDEETKLANYKQLYADRVRANYEAGQVSYLEVLLSASSFSEYLTRIDLVQQIMDYDNKLMENMKSCITNIEDTIVLVDAKRAEQQEVQDQLDAQMAELTAKEYELQCAIDEITANEIEWAARSEAADAELDESLAYLDELIATSGGTAPGVLDWPTPGHTLITDYWGTRPNPFGSGYVGHNGVDIGVSTGTPVYAMASGTVISQYYDSGVGNLIIIDHGGGLSTRFYHLSEALVSVGDYVERGQLVAYSGNTGWQTTGPHLHFEVRVYDPSVGYSVSVNPLDYCSPY